MTTVVEYFQELVEQNALIQTSETSFETNNVACLYEWYAPDRQTTAHVKNVTIKGNEISMDCHIVDNEFDPFSGRFYTRGYPGLLRFNINKFPYNEFKVLPNKI